MLQTLELNAAVPFVEVVAHPVNQKVHQPV